MAAATQKKVIRIAHKNDVMEGAGVMVGRALPNPGIPPEEVDPFLLLDEAEIDPKGPAFPRHPHRGFEILTYITRGWANHKDSLGNEAQVHAGGVMRITAGSGLWHEEGFGEKSDQPIHGAQFWVNLPLDKKSLTPSVQFAEEADLPVSEKDGVRVKQMVGPDSPIKVVTPMHYLDVAIQGGSTFEWTTPADFQGYAYLMDGEGFFGPDQKPAEKGDVVVLGEGETLVVKAKGGTGANFLLALGRPLRQPVRWNGPYVD